MSWNIRRTKRFVPSPLIKEEDKILLSEWQQYVDSDSELMWEEESPIAKDFKSEGIEWIKEENFRKQAYHDFNVKKNWAGLRFSFFQGTISVNTERQTLKRVEKMWDVAEALKGYLYKKGTRFTEKKLEKLREKQNKNRKQTSGDDQDA